VNPAICDRCGELLRSSSEVVEERVELRALRSLRRLRTWRVRLICRACAETLAFEHDHPHGPPPEQARLL
jgi:hypothetical protein